MLLNTESRICGLKYITCFFHFSNKFNIIGSIVDISRLLGGYKINMQYGLGSLWLTEALSEFALENYTC